LENTDIETTPLENTNVENTEIKTRKNAIVTSEKVLIIEEMSDLKKCSPISKCVIL
jgi:hypothetical protein